MVNTAEVKLDRAGDPRWAGGDRAEWFAQALEGIESEYPAVKALLFFHVDADATVTRQTIDWGFQYDSAVVEAVRKGLEKLTSGEG